MRKMTAAEYLKERGWIRIEESEGKPADGWIDPVTLRFLTFAPTATGGCVRIQKSRDAAEERRVWSEQMASVVATAVNNPLIPDVEKATRTSAYCAGMALAAYKEFFAIEIVEDTVITLKMPGGSDAP